MGVLVIGAAPGSGLVSGTALGHRRRAPIAELSGNCRLNTVCGRIEATVAQSSPSRAGQQQRLPGTGGADVLAPIGSDYDRLRAQMWTKEVWVVGDHGKLSTELPDEVLLDCGYCAREQ